MTNRRILAMALVVTIILLPSAASTQETSGPVGIVDTGTASPVTAVRSSADGNSVVVTVPEALRPDGMWKLTVVVLSSRARPTRTIVAIDGASLSATAEQDSAVTGETTAMGARAVEQISAGEMSIELPEPDLNAGDVLWVVTEQEGAPTIVSPIFRQNELRRAQVPIKNAGLGWLTNGDDQSSWYWVAVPASPTMAIDDGVLVVRPDESPLERVSGQEVGQVVEHVILRNADGGPPLLDINLDFRQGTAAATLADGTTFTDLPWTSGEREPDPDADIRGGIDLDLDVLATETGITIEDTTTIGLTRELNLDDGAQVLVDGIDVPISELAGSLGAPIEVAALDGEAEGAPTDSAATPLAADSNEGVERTTLIGIWAAALGLAVLLCWSIWRGLRSSKLKRWRSTRRRHKLRDREARKRRAAKKSMSP